MAELLTAVALFAGSLVVLLASSDRFVAATARIGLSLGISPFVIGATIVAGGTSLPELVSSALAATQGATTIVIGNVVGSNVANILVVLGLTAVVGRRIYVERELVRVDLPILVTSASFLLVASWDGTFAWYEGLLALAGLVVYVHFTLARPARLDETVEELVETYAEPSHPETGLPLAVEHEAPARELGPDLRTYVVLVVSLVLVFVSAHWLVVGIVDVAAIAGVGTELVAITAVGLGTSLPEIAVSVAAVRGGDPEIAVGNVLGSNIVNSFGVMVVPSLLGPLAIPAGVRTYALPVMVLATVLYYFVTQDREITRWEGAVLLVLYVAFLVNLVRLG